MCKLSTREFAPRWGSLIGFAGGNGRTLPALRSGAPEGVDRRPHSRPRREKISGSDSNLSGPKAVARSVLTESSTGKEGSCNSRRLRWIRSSPTPAPRPVVRPGDDENRICRVAVKQRRGVLVVPAAGRSRGAPCTGRGVIDLCGCLRRTDVVESADNEHSAVGEMCGRFARTAPPSTAISGPSRQEHAGIRRSDRLEGTAG
jgi:hypothetical protein